MPGSATERRAMLSLLRFALWGDVEQAGHWPECDWGHVLTLAERQLVHALVAKAVVRLSEYGELKAVDEHLMERCLATQFATMKKNLQLNGVLAEVVQLLQNDGQQPMLIKGQGVAQCYPIPELRMPGDIDLYIGDVDLAASLLRQHYPDADFSDAHPRHAVLELRGVDVELHRYLLDKTSESVFESLQRLIKEEESRREMVTIGSTRVLTPSPLLHAVFLFCHFRLHFMNDGIGLRQLCDWALYLHRYHDAIDEQRLRSWLAESGLTRNWQCFGDVVVSHLGLPATEFPCYGGRHRLMASWILEEILYFGHQGHEYYRRWRAAQKGSLLRLKLRSMAVFTAAYLCNMMLSPGKGWQQLCHFYGSARMKL